MQFIAKFLVGYAALKPYEIRMEDFESFQLRARVLFLTLFSQCPLYSVEGAFFMDFFCYFVENLSIFRLALEPTQYPMYLMFYYQIRHRL